MFQNRTRGLRFVWVSVLIVGTVIQTSGDDLSRARDAFLPSLQGPSYSLEAVAATTRERSVVTHLADAVAGKVQDGTLSASSDFEGKDSVLASLVTDFLQRAESDNMYLRHLRSYKSHEFLRYDTEEDFFGDINTNLPPRYKCTWIWKPAPNTGRSQCFFINHLVNEARIATGGSYKSPPLTWEILTYPKLLQAMMALLVGPDLKPGAKPALPLQNIDEDKLAELVAGKVRGVRLETEIDDSTQRTKLFWEDSSVPRIEILLGLVGTNAYPLLALIRDSDSGHIQTAHAIYYARGFSAPAGGIAFSFVGAPSERLASVCRFIKFQDNPELSEEIFDLGDYSRYSAVLDQVSRTYYTNGVLDANVVWSDKPAATRKTMGITQGQKRLVVITVFFVVSLTALGWIIWRLRTR